MKQTVKNEQLADQRRIYSYEVLHHYAAEGHRLIIEFTVSTDGIDYEDYWTVRGSTVAAENFNGLVSNSDHFRSTLTQRLLAAVVDGTAKLVR